VAEQIVKRANKSITEFGPIFDALGLTDTKDPEQMKANMAKRKEDNAAAEKQREALRQSILFKSYEFNCHGVEMNQRYTSNAIVSDGTPEPEYPRDKELYYEATTWPGAHLPHVWLGDDGKRISTFDLAGRGKFTLFTGIGGHGWVEAIAEIEKEFGLDINTVEVGPGKAYTDLYGEWADAREITESGCLLIRPDYHVAYRAQSASSDPLTDLRNAFKQILGR
jgi:2,4-dichlorophenol 6-monooxygenase